MESITYLTSAYNRWWETAKEDLHGYQHASYHYRSRSAARAAAGTLQSVQSPLRQAACRAFIRVVASFARAPASCSKLSYVGRD